jgi:hypothetical protein
MVIQRCGNDIYRCEFGSFLDAFMRADLDFFDAENTNPSDYQGRRRFPFSRFFFPRFPIPAVFW